MMGGIFCDICGKHFENKKSFRQHEERHKVGDFYCEVGGCSKTFSSKISFKDHQRKSHSPVIFQCKICSKTYISKQKLQIHEEIHREDMKEDCFYCQKKFTKSTLFRHQEEVCKNRKSKENIKETTSSDFKCKKCNNDFLTEESLKMHQSQYHKYKCPECEKIYASKIALNVHKKIHSSDSNKCHLCDKPLKSSLKRHIENTHKVVSGDNFMYVPKKVKKSTSKVNSCPICRKNFTRNYNFNIHMKQFHNKKQNNSSTISMNDSFMSVDDNENINIIASDPTCSICQETFKDVFLLQRHISITHDGFSLLKCPECSKAFGKKKNLNKHINSVHSINNNFPCTVCDEEFNTKYSLKRHKKRMHETIPLKKGHPCKPDTEISERQMKNRAKQKANTVQEDLENNSTIKEATLKIILENNFEAINSMIKERMNPLTESEVISIINNASLSDRQFHIIHEELQKKWGSSIKTPNITAALAMRKKIFADLFDKVKHTFEDKAGTIDRTAIICNDVKTTVERVCKYRGLDIAEYDNIIGIDDGKDMLKIVLSMVRKDRSVEKDKQDTTEENEDEDIKRFKESGVKKVIILAGVKNV